MGPNFGLRSVSTNRCRMWGKSEGCKARQIAATRPPRRAHQIGAELRPPPECPAARQIGAELRPPRRPSAATRGRNPPSAARTSPPRRQSAATRPRPERSDAWARPG